MRRKETGKTSYEERSLRNARRASNASWWERGLEGATGGWVARDGRRTTDAPAADWEERRPVRDTEGILVGPSVPIDGVVEEGVDIEMGRLSCWREVRRSYRRPGGVGTGEGDGP
jgi:hypothetical protein